MTEAARERKALKEGKVERDDRITMSTSTTSTPQPPRRSLIRPRVSIGNQAANPASTPNPQTRYASPQRPPLPSQASGSGSGAAFARKVSLGQSNLAKTSNLADGSISQTLKTLQDSGSSPLNAQKTPPIMSRLATNHKGIHGDDLEVGDAVDVPGGMHGTVKFIGEVKGKKGIFAGVELSREWAARGKNDGDVEG